MSETPPELQSRLEETFTALDQAADAYRAELKAQEVGTVRYVGVGIALVEGLP